MPPASAASCPPCVARHDLIGLKVSSQLTGTAAALADGGSSNNGEWYV